MMHWSQAAIVIVIRSTVTLRKSAIMIVIVIRSVVTLRKPV